MEKKKQSIRKTKHENSCGHTTIFDDVFRTMKGKMPSLLIPLVNEVFGTNYETKDIVSHTADTHMTKRGKRITDACTYIRNRCYHIECQSKIDSTIAIRMFEYDVSIAMGNIRNEDGKKVIRFPYSAVLYLRHNSRTKDKEELIIRFDGGNEYTYSVPVIKLQDYTLTDIWEKQLYIMLPFYLLRYEKWLSGKKKDENMKNCLLSDCKQIHDKLLELSDTDNDGENNLPIPEMDELVKRIANYILRRKSDIKKEVDAIMGGQVLEFSWETIERLKRELAESKDKAAVAESKRQRAENKRQRAESKRQQAESKRQQAESKRQQAEANYAALVQMIKEGRFAELELAISEK